MMTLCQGDLFNDDAQAIVNVVNCVGVMGGGIALEFRKRYHDYYLSYVDDCKTGRLVPGKVSVFDAGGIYIVSFPTKNHYIHPARYSYLEAGLPALVSALEQHGIESVALQALGCGLGGLDWAKALPILYEHLGGARVDARVYEPLHF